MQIFALIIALIWPGKATDAGVVKDINANKGQIVVALKNEVAENGDSICVYSAKNKKISCGSVVRVSDDSAYVKFFSKKDLKKIKKGFRTAVIGGGSAVADTSGKSSGFKLWAGYMPAIMTPAVYNNLGYSAPSEGTSTLWEPDSAVTSALFGVGLQGSFAVGRIALIPGLRYRIFDTKNVDDDYNPGRTNPYVSTTTSSTAIGLFTDARLFEKSVGSMLAFYAVSGVDIDMSTVTIKSEKKDDTGATAEASVASATSNLTVISLRAGGGFNLIPYKPFGVSAGINFLLPLLELGKKFAGSLEENESRGLAEPGEDFKDKLGHKKNGFGLDVQLSVLLAF